MLKVILVDDEPFILQGLSVLIDWKSYDYEIVGTFANGKLALDYLRENTVDLIIADVKMPEMNGIELLKTIREEKVSNANFIILSGYSEFYYAQEAMKYNCTGYMLKPVDKDELITILQTVYRKHMEATADETRKDNMEKAYLARNVISLLVGKYDHLNIEYVEKCMKLSEGVRFVDIEFASDVEEQDTEDNELRNTQRELYRSCMDILQEDKAHAIFDVSHDEGSYDTALIYCDYMAEDRELSEEEYIEWFHGELVKYMNRPVTIYVGKKVSDISNISKSFASVRILKSFESFRSEKSIYYYEEEAQVNQGGVVLCKPNLDKLVSAIEHDNREEIEQAVSSLYEEMKRLGMNSETINLNINYFLFQLIHIAAKQDDEINQEEILHFISESSFHDGVKRGSSTHLTAFALEYAEYLSQLRKNMSSGVLLEIEKEIEARYAENLSLRELGKKYFINSSYLGQVFRKKYGKSFKDYLSDYRINEAAYMLIKTDKKINMIAEEVGYRDSDYFIRKFIEIKGCTPSKYRKNSNGSM